MKFPQKTRKDRCIDSQVGFSFLFFSRNRGFRRIANLSICSGTVDCRLSNSSIVHNIPSLAFLFFSFAQPRFIPHIPIHPHQSPRHILLAISISIYAHSHKPQRRIAESKNRTLAKKKRKSHLTIDGYPCRMCEGDYTKRTRATSCLSSLLFYFLDVDFRKGSVGREGVSREGRWLARSSCCLTEETED